MARPPVANGHRSEPAAASALATEEVSDPGRQLLVRLLRDRRGQVLEAWVQRQLATGAYRSGRVSEAEVRSESAVLLEAILPVMSRGGGFAVADDAELSALLASMSVDRARQGYTPSETAVAVFSLKDALVEVLDEVYGDDPALLAVAIRAMNTIVDGMGLQTFEAFTAGREAVLKSQQQSLLELSTPVVKLWDGIVAVPLIGTLDSGRSQTVMENLLQAIVDTGSQIAIVDITGVPMVDTLVAQHLLKTAAATRLMGADCIISGIRPQIAQTMVHLGVDLGTVVTKATLADAFRVALRRVGADLSAAAAR